MKILNITQQTVLADAAQMADTALSRLKGLIGRVSISPGEAMVITHCRSIHMVFMRFAIDAVFVDRKNRVVGLVRHIKPFQISAYFWRSSYVIELPVGSIDRTCTSLGDTISLGQ